MKKKSTKNKINQGITIERGLKMNTIELNELLLKAAKHNLSALIPTLIKSGADVNAKDSLGRTVLTWAASYGRIEIVKELLKVPGILVNKKDMIGYTALIRAASHGHAEVVRELLKVPDILINAKDQYGWTARMSAVSNGHIEVVNLLKEKGAK